MRILFWLVIAAVLSSCAVETKGILVNVEPGTPMDETDLYQHCDLGDQAACVLSGTHNTPLPPPSLSIIQGLAPPDRAIFTALQPKSNTLFWYIYDRETAKLTKLFTVNAVSRGDSPYSIQRIDASGLLPNRPYELLGGDAEGRLVEYRSFRPLASMEAPLRAEIFTGWRLIPHNERMRLLAAARTRKPQFFVLAGSVAEASLPPSKSEIKGKESRAFFFERQAAARATFELGLERELFPIAALWNDDEFGKPDSGFSFHQRDEAREMMELFFPHGSDESSIVDGPGISVAFDLHPFELILADDLSFRQAPAGGELKCHKRKGYKHEICKQEKLIPAPDGTRYGGLMRDWIEGRSQKAGRPIWLLTGGPHIVPYSPEWYLQPALLDPNLSRPPEKGGLWELSAERNGTPTLSPLP